MEGVFQLRMVRGEPDGVVFVPSRENGLAKFRGKEEFIAFNLPQVIQVEPDAGWLGSSQLLEAKVLLRTDYPRPGCRHMFHTLSLIT